MPRKPVEFEGHPAPYLLAANWRRAVGRYVVDGDTIDVMVDVGFNTYVYQTLRLHNVDTPEIYGGGDEAEKAEGRAARVRVEELAGPGLPLIVRTYKDRQTFGRYVAEVRWWNAERRTFVDLGATLVAEGHAKQSNR